MILPNNRGVRKKCFVQNSKLGYLIFFLFLGSGSTFIGLEQICYEAH